MKKINTILLSLATLIVVGACSRNKDSYDEFDFSGERTVNFTASVASIGDQAATKWQLGDAIGIYAVTAGEPLAPENLYKEKENVKYTTTSTATFGKFVSAKPTDAIQNACLPMDIIAYYPYTAEVKDFQYPIATQNQTALLYANNLKNLRDSKEAHLEFKHKLSMLELTIEAANSDTDLSSLQATKIEGLYTEGSMDLNTGEVLVHENAAMQAISPTVVAEKDKAQVKAILLPNQSLANIQLHLSLDGKEIIWTPENEVDLAGGKIFIYTIQMESDGQFTAVNPEGDIADWVEGNDGSVDQLTPNVDDSGTISLETYVSFSEAGGESALTIEASSKGLKWSASSQEDWITVSPSEGEGSGELNIKVAQNKTGEIRTGIVQVKHKKKTHDVLVYQNAREEQEGKIIILEEGFGVNDGSKWDLMFGDFDTYQGFDTSTVVYSNKGSRLGGRARSSFLNFEKHLWFPAYNPKYPITKENPAPTLNISNIDALDLKEISISFDMTGNFNNNPLFVNYINLTADGKPIELEEIELTAADYKDAYYTVVIKNVQPFSELEFTTDERNLTGIRFDNLKITGVK